MARTSASTIAPVPTSDAPHAPVPESGRDGLKKAWPTPSVESARHRDYARLHVTAESARRRAPGPAFSALRPRTTRERRPVPRIRRARGGANVRIDDGAPRHPAHLAQPGLEVGGHSIDGDADIRRIEAVVVERQPDRAVTPWHEASPRSRPSCTATERRWVACESSGVTHHELRRALGAPALRTRPPGDRRRRSSSTTARPGRVAAASRQPVILRRPRRAADARP